MYGSFDSQTYSCMVLNLNDEVNKKMLLMLTFLLFFYFLIFNELTKALSMWNDLRVKWRLSLWIYLNSLI